MNQNTIDYPALQKKLRPLLAQLKVLIVDDMPTNIDAYRLILLDLGIARENITTATNGLIAFATMTSQPDLILADWNMPVMDGLAFSKKVREYPVHQHRIILMITAEEEADLEQARPYVNAFLRKPATNDTIYKMILSVLAKKVADPDHKLTIP